MDAKNQQDRAKMVEEAVGRMSSGNDAAGNHKIQRAGNGP